MSIASPAPREHEAKDARRFLNAHLQTSEGARDATQFIQYGIRGNAPGTHKRRCLGHVFFFFGCHRESLLAAGLVLSAQAALS